MNLRQLEQVRSQFGVPWLLYRGAYAAKMRLGWMRRRLPARDWPGVPLGDFFEDRGLAEEARYLNYRRQKTPSFFFRPSDRQSYQGILAAWDDKSANNPQQQAAAVGRGVITYFGRTEAQVGFPPDWFADPFTNQRVPVDRHWSRIADFDFGDIKVIWEPSRFGFVYTLVRAYWRTGDEGFSDWFWRLVEDWRDKNQPQMGVNWKCGQEIAFRVMAWLFGLYGFLHAQATTARRVTELAQMIAVSGERIEANLGYALSQQNNHGISEGMGLWTIGLLFPEFKAASRWKERGRQVLEEQARSLVYNDGSFSQHSFNYHRLMLQDYLWAIRLGDLHGQSLSKELFQRVQGAGEFLYQNQEQSTGRVPCYGQNDGALILPLNNCDYRDFRPATQAICYLCKQSRCHPSGPWDEDLLWLFGPEALKSDVTSIPRSDWHAADGGYYVLRSREGFVFTRCAPSFRHRPGQADLLHVDLWWHGQNIALDAGTYSYNSPDPWNNPLSHTACHNTVSVDGLDQMERAGKFMWLPWIRGKVHKNRKSQGGRLAYWEGEHDGYRRLREPVCHRRGVLRFCDENWLILDYLSSEAYHHYCLQWLLADMPYDYQEDNDRIVLHTEAGPYYVVLGASDTRPAFSLVRADERRPRGWRASYYMYREPALSVGLEGEAKEMWFWTLFSPSPIETSDQSPFQMSADNGRLTFQHSGWRARVDLEGSPKHSLVNAVFLSGEPSDQLLLSGV